MRNKQVQILYGISIIYIAGMLSIHAAPQIGAALTAIGTVCLLAYTTGILIKGDNKMVCKNCRSIIPQKSRICPECGFCYSEGIAEDKLTEFIAQQKEMSSEQINREFEKIESISLDEVAAYDGDIEDFLQNRCKENEI